MFTYDSGSDVERLCLFVEDIRKFINDALYNFQELFISNLVGFYNEVWYTETNLERFSELTRAIRETDLNVLSSHGLLGAELSLKLATANTWYERFIAFPGMGIFKRVIDAIDTLLDSIIAAVGSGGAIKELKDTLRNILNDY